MSWKTRAFTRAGALALCSALMGLFCAVANAATISYGDFNAPPSAMFLDVEESSVGSPLPLYGPPTPFSGSFQAGLDFDPKSFVAVSAGGGPPDVVDGQLNFTVMSPGLVSLNLFESGDYTLVGLGTPATFVTAAASIRATVTQINGVNVAPIAVGPVSSSFTDTLPPSVALAPWSVGVGINIAAALGPGQNATKVEIVIDNQLIAASELTSAAFIAKKEFIIDTDIIPEPATFALSALALCGAAFGMRRRS